MKLTDALCRECIAVGQKCRDKAEALRTVARTAKQSPILEHISEEDLLAALKDRESLGTTGFGRGVAIPHCRVESVRRFVVGVVTVPDGVEFASTDGQKVRLMVFIVAPAWQSNEHIRLLSSISQSILRPGTVDQVVAQNTPGEIYHSLVQQTRTEIDIRNGEGMSMVQVFIQDEDVFQGILEVLATVEPGSPVVIDGEGAATYLARMPLFAGFWHEQPSRFCRIIMGVVDRRLTNEVLRRIESITGNLKERTGVMVTMQPIAYTAGSLETQG